MRQLYILIAFLFLFLDAFTQSEIGLPYSAFGMGQINNANNVRNKSMGGIGISTRDYFTINLKNPASFTAFDTTSFLFEGSMIGNYTNLKTETVDEVSNSAAMGSLMFGFPVTHFWRSSFGLVPYSMVGYNVFDNEVKEGIGSIEYAFKGSGGISRFYWGNAIQFKEGLSIGVNASYLFGTIDKTHTVAFPDSAYIINTNEINSVTISDWYVDFGIQYYRKIKRNIHLTVGAVFNPKFDLGAKRSYMSRTFYGSVNSIDIFRDTIAFVQDELGKVTAPMGIGGGFSFNKPNHWLIGFDYKFDQWSEYKHFGEIDSLTNSHSFNIGGQIIPNSSSITYSNRIDYRMGVKFSRSYLKLRGEQLNTFGITFGVGLPLRSVAVRGSRSMINLGVELGRMGTIGKGLIQENYANVYIGLAIYEWWFFKRRYQ